MKKGLILTVISPFHEYEVRRVKEEAEQEGIVVDIFNYDEISIEFLENVVVRINRVEVNLSDYAWCFLNQSSGNGKQYLELKTILVKRMVQLNVHVINSNTLLEFPKLSKLMQQWEFYDHKIPYIKSLYCTSLSQIDEEMSFPRIVKEVFGSRGEKVYLAKDYEGLVATIKNGSRNGWLIQPRLMTGADVRVSMLSGKVIGAMKRTAREGSYLSNFSQGGTVEPFVLNEQLEDLCMRLSSVFHLDYVGVDIMFDEAENPFVLELNRHAQFKGFERATGINVARRILDYLQQQ